MKDTDRVCLCIGVIQQLQGHLPSKPRVALICPLLLQLLLTSRLCVAAEQSRSNSMRVPCLNASNGDAYLIVCLASTSRVIHLAE
jgi:hypothetical protein